MQEQPEFQKFIDIPIPQEHYWQVVQFVSQLRQGSDTQVVTTRVEKTRTGRVKAKTRPRRDWTEPELADLKQEVSKRSVLSALFKLITERPGQLVSMTEFETETGFTRRQLRSALAGMTQFIGKRFERSNWPFYSEWNVDNNGQQSYAMTEELAQMWNRV